MNLFLCKQIWRSLGKWNKFVWLESLYSLLKYKGETPWNIKNDTLIPYKLQCYSYYKISKDNGNHSTYWVNVTYLFLNPYWVAHVHISFE
jgi:hypothetical protein